MGGKNTVTVQLDEKNYNVDEQQYETTVDLKFYGSTPLVMKKFEPVKKSESGGSAVAEIITKFNSKGAWVRENQINFGKKRFSATLRKREGVVDKDYSGAIYCEVKRIPSESKISSYTLTINEFEAPKDLFDSEDETFDVF